INNAIYCALQKFSFIYRHVNYYHHFAIHFPSQSTLQVNQTLAFLKYLAQFIFLAHIDMHK
ncbi:MAG: hypothetical protein QM498_10725, partial [Desulfobacterium sp.]